MDEKKGTVLDPYCGSGTTLVAAKILRHSYIGIDISKQYINFAEKRIKNYEKEIVFVQQEMTKHIVVKTFKERKMNGEFTGRYGPQNGKAKLINSQKELTLFKFKE